MVRKKQELRRSPRAGTECYAKSSRQREFRTKITHPQVRRAETSGGCNPPPRRKGAPMKRLEGKVIIVTGSSMGIGAASARRCVQEGARVLVHGLEREAGEAVAAALGDSAVFHGDDLADVNSAGRIVSAAITAFGKLDGLV